MKLCNYFNLAFYGIKAIRFSTKKAIESLGNKDRNLHKFYLWRFQWFW